MPWDEIDSGERDTEITEMKRLIAMRKNLQACKSRNFHFPNDIPKDRVISYIKIGEHESLQIYLNCEDEAVEINTSDFSEVVYSRKWETNSEGHGILYPNGILILKK